MGIIERNLEISGIKSKRILAFFDSGSSFSIIKKSLVDDVGYFKKKKVKLKVEIGNGDSMLFTEMVLISIKLNKIIYTDYYVVGDIPEQMIIGVDFLQKYGHTLEFKNDKIVGKNLHLKNRRGRYVL